MSGTSRPRQLLLSSAALIGSLTGYGRGAYAQCAVVPLSTTTYRCANAVAVTQEITGPTGTGLNNAYAYTVSGFSAGTSGSPITGSSIEISGEGAISFVDTVAGTTLVGTTYGIDITSTGDDAGGGIDGSVFVSTNATIFGYNAGIFANNNGSGSLEIIANGDVQRADISAIDARSAGTDLKVTTGADADIIGSIYGIYASNTGVGNTDITVGKRARAVDYAIYAKTSATTGDLTVNAVRVESFGYGIYTMHAGTGDLTITTTGEVTTDLQNNFGRDAIRAINTGSGAINIKTYGDVTTGNRAGYIPAGIYARNGTYGAGAGTHLSVTTAAGTTVTGEFDGIWALNYGTGIVDVTVNGTASGIDGTGISAYGGANTTGMTVNAAKATGRLRGIDAHHNGGGTLEVTTTDEVTGTEEFGIIGRSGTASTGQTITADKTVTGYLAGIVGTHEGSGVLSITAKGDTIATGSGGPYQGIAAYTGVASSGLTVNAVNAEGTEGIRAFHFGTGALQITTTGTVTGVETYGLLAATRDHQAGAMTISTAKVMGETVGLWADHYYGSGALNVTATDEVTSTTGYGIIAIGGQITEGVTVNAAAVRGGDEAIQAELQGSGALSVTTTGAVDGVSYGVHTTNEGTGATEITTKAAVTATNGEGISAFGDSNTTSMTIHAATVTGGNKGINADHLGGGALEIVATGAVTGTNEYGIKAYSAQGTGLTIGADKNVTGGLAVYAMHLGTGALSITVKGDATSTIHQGIFAYTGYDSSSLTINAAGATGSEGIHADHAGSGPLSIVTHGEVVGDSLGIHALNFGSGATNITVKAGSSVTSTGLGGNDVAIESVLAPTNLIVAGTLNGGGGGAVLLDQGQVLDDRVELQPTAQINGNVRAGPGDDTLAFAGSGNGAFDLNAIDTGTNTKQFQSFENFQVESGSWSFSGATTAAFMQTGGTLNNFGTFSDVTVNGGTLTGPGTFGNVTVNGGAVNGTGTFGSLAMSGGTLAPGNSIGTMTVNGSFSMAAASTFQVEVNAAGQNDKVIVNGTVNLTGAALRVLAANGNYKPSTDYTIIQKNSAGAVSGTFSTVTTNFAFLTPIVDYRAGDGNDVVLTLLRTVVPNTGGGAGGGPGGGGNGNPSFLSFCSVAQTKNQCDVALALDKFPFANPLFQAVLTQTADGARQAFDVLSGEVHATVAGTLVDDSRYAREAVLGRLMQARHMGGALGNGGPEVAGYDSQAMMLGGADMYDGKSPVEVPVSQPLAFWTQAFGAWGAFDGNTNAASAARDLGGFISGMDASIGGSWRMGLATGASFSDVSVDARYSGANTSTYHLGGYVGGEIEGFALRGGGLWAWSEIETSRAVVFPRFYERQTADYNADTGQLFGEIAYPTQAAGVELEPFAGLAYVSVESGGFREKGGPQASLRSAGIDQDVGYTTVGLRAAKAMMWGNMRITPHIEAAWLHAFDNVTPGASLAFAGTGIGFDVDGVPLAEDSALLDAGVDFALSDRLSAGVSYSGQYADTVSDNAVKGRLTWLFH